VGYFGIFSAVLDGNPDDIAGFFKEFFKENATRRQNKEEFYYRDDLLLYARHNNWMVIKWPREYFSHNETSIEISKKFETIVSAVNVYDGDFWEHYFCKNGTLLDKFHSAPDYFDEISKKSLKYIDPGDAQLIATELKIDVARIKPYFNRDRSWDTPTKKAFPEDIYNITDGLAFIDFWEKLGIQLPEESEIPKHAFKISDDFLKKLFLSRF